MVARIHERKLTEMHLAIRTKQQSNNIIRVNNNQGKEKSENDWHPNPSSNSVTKTCKYIVVHLVLLKSKLIISPTLIILANCLKFVFKKYCFARASTGKRASTI